MDDDGQREQAAKQLLEFVASPRSTTSEADLVLAGTVIDAIAEAVRVAPTEHARAVDLERRKG